MADINTCKAATHLAARTTTQYLRHEAPRPGDIRIDRRVIPRFITRNRIVGKAPICDVLSRSSHSPKLPFIHVAR
jgi:hypothetical protein